MLVTQWNDTINRDLVGWCKHEVTNCLVHDNNIYAYNSRDGVVECIPLTNLCVLEATPDEVRRARHAIAAQKRELGNDQLVKEFASIVVHKVLTWSDDENVYDASSDIQQALNVKFDFKIRNTEDGFMFDYFDRLFNAEIAISLEELCEQFGLFLTNL